MLVGGKLGCFGLVEVVGVDVQGWWFEREKKDIQATLSCFKKGKNQCQMRKKKLISSDENKKEYKIKNNVNPC